MGLVSPLLGAAILAAASFAPGRAEAQCRTATVTGATSTVNNVAGSPVPGSSVAATGATDGTYYQVTNVLGLVGTPSVRTMFSTMVENGYTNAGGRGGGPVYYGGVFSNPTASAITVTQVDVTTNITPGAPTGSGITNASGLFFDMDSASTTPATGTGSWTRVSQNLIRWTGSLSVPANSAQAFIFASQTTFSDSIWSYTAAMTVTAGGTPYASSSFTIQTAGSSNPYASNAVVGFDTPTAPSTYAPQAYLSSAGYTAGTTIDLPIRVRETGNNPDAQNGIERNLQLVVTIPAGWTAVSVKSSATPWSAKATATILQPTSTTAGSVTINTLNTTNGRIARGSSTPAGSLVITATAPAGTYVTSLFPFTFTLDGVSQTTPPPPGPVDSKNESVVRVVGSPGTAGVNTEYLSAAMPGPVRQIVLRAELNMLAGTGSETVNVDAFDNLASSWTNLGSATPAASPNSVVTFTFGANLNRYMDGAGRIKVRLVSSGAAGRVLGLDLLQWAVTQGYTVNNATGNDLNVGDVARPFKTVGAALAALGVSGGAYVETGNSRTAGQEYAAGNVISGAGKAGTTSCATLLQGVPDGSGFLPLLKGSNPSTDVGFDVSSNYVTIDSIEVRNTQVGFYSEPSTVGARFSNSIVTVPSLGYGFILDTSSQALVLNNRADGGGSGSFFGVWDFSGSGNTVDGNRILGHGTAGIMSFGSTGLTLQRNVSRGNTIGAHISHPTGAVTVSNNTFDANSYLGIYAESVTTLTSRNNIVTGSGAAGWAWNGSGSVGSDYDDVFGNTSNYSFHGTVGTGAHSISAAPSFVQTSSPALATYYQLNPGSPCIDKGVNVGLPFLGSAPDIGAVETQ